MIPQPLVQQFADLYKQHFGVDLDPDLARSEAVRLVRLVRGVYWREPCTTCSPSAKRG